MSGSEYEFHLLTTADGQEYRLDNGVDRVLLVRMVGNAGLPPIDRDAEQGYLQPGETVRQSVYLPRVISLEFRYQGGSRAAYHAARAALLDVMRFNRGGPLTYTFIRRDGVQRAIQGYANTPNFPLGNADTWDEWAFDETLEIECPNPLWFNPEVFDLDFPVGATANHLVYPKVYPKQYGGGAYASSLVITYAGTWYSYPVVTISGACSSWRLDHVELGKSIIYPRPMAAGDTLTLDLRRESRGLTDQNGASLWGYIDWENSNVIDFRIEPSGILSGGTNTLTFSSQSVSPLDVSLEFYERFVGI